MSSLVSSSAVHACPWCLQVQRLPLPELAYRCCRCHHRLPSAPAAARARSRCLAWTAAALLLYLPAILLPIMQVERFGHRHSAGVFDGAVSLMVHGDVLIGGLLLLVSVIVPAFKLLGLLVLCSGSRQGRWRLQLYHLLELVGRWGMLDVLLVAMLVALVKLGDLVQIQLGPGAAAFGCLVACNLIASASLPPASLWRPRAETRRA